MSRIVKQGIPANDVQLVFDDFVNNGYMVSYVQTNSDGQNVTIDFVFEPSTGCPFECRNWLSELDFQQMDADLTAIGFTQVCANSFPYQGQIYYCGLWINTNH